MPRDYIHNRTDFADLIRVVAAGTAATGGRPIGSIHVPVEKRRMPKLHENSSGRKSFAGSSPATRTMLDSYSPKSLE